MSESKRIYLFRNAYSCANYKKQEGIISRLLKTARKDPGLTIYGIIQTLLQDTISVPFGGSDNRVYVSSLIRSWQTAILLFGHRVRGTLILQITPFLKETGTGMDNVPDSFENQMNNIADFIAILRGLRSLLAIERRRSEPDSVNSGLLVEKLSMILALTSITIEMNGEAHSIKMDVEPKNIRNVYMKSLSRLIFHINSVNNIAKRTMPTVMPVETPIAPTAPIAPIAPSDKAAMDADKILSNTFERIDRGERISEMRRQREEASMKAKEMANKFRSQITTGGANYEEDFLKSDIYKGIDSLLSVGGSTIVVVSHKNVISDFIDGCTDGNNCKWPGMHYNHMRVKSDIPDNYNTWYLDLSVSYGKTADKIERKGVTINSINPGQLIPGKNIQYFIDECEFQCGKYDSDKCDRTPVSKLFKGSTGGRKSRRQRKVSKKTIKNKRAQTLRRKRRS